MGYKRLADGRPGAALALVLAALALVLAFVPRAALADETDSSSIDPFDYLTLDVTASTEGLADNQVQVSVTGTNKVGMELADHAVSFKVPDGWTLVSGSASSTPAKTADGESVSTTAVLAKNASDGGGSSDAADGSGAAGTGTAATSTAGKTPETGDESATVVAIAFVALIAAAALFASKKLRFRATLSIMLAALLVLNMIPASALQAMADEASGAQATSTDASTTDADATASTSDDSSLFSLSKTFDLDVRGEKLSIAATVSCNATNGIAPGIVNLELKRSVPVGASSVNVSVLSQTAYAGASETAGECRSFDISKIELTGSLEGATVRKGAYTVKVDGKNEESSDLKDRTHYELRFIIDSIPEGAASEDSDYGYIELKNQPFADQEQGYGVACVSYSKPSGSIAQVTSTAPMGGDVASHTFDNGKYWDGNNLFRVPVDLDGIEVGMPIPTTSEFASYAHGDTYTIDGVEYRRFTAEDIVNGISFNDVGYDIDVIDCTEDLAYTWVTFRVNNATGTEAYELLTQALAKDGLLFGGQITSTYANTIVYPASANSDGSTSAADAFAYAQTSPVAFAYAVQVERGEKNTTVTYLAGLHSSQEAEDEVEVGDIDLLDTTTFSAYRISTDENGSSTEALASDVSVTPYDAEKDLFKIEVAVPNDQFDSDAKLLGLSTSDTDGLLDAMSTYVSNVNLRMTGGSTNAFGVPEKDAAVALFDGESLNRADSDDEAATSDAAAVSDSTAADEAAAVALSDDGATAEAADVIAAFNPGDVICKYESLAGAAAPVADQAGENVKQIDTIYRKTSSDSKSDARMKQILSSAVSTGLGINHAINLVTVLGKSFLNYATAGFTIVGLLGVFISDLLPQETQMYTVDDVINKLDEMNKKLDTVETTVKTINVKLDEQASTTAWHEQLNTYTNLKSLLCSTTTSNIFEGMDNVLGKYYELDANGKKTTKVCSRSTSVSRMPKEAIDALDDYLQGIDKNAKNKGFQTGIGGAYTALHNLLLTGDNLSSNILDTYYSYVNTKYNWDVETNAAKRAFLASLMIMYNNAYALYSAELSIQLYRANGNVGKTEAVNVQMKELQQYANDISTVLYGEVNWDQLRKDYPGESRSSSHEPTVTATDVDTAKILKDNPGKTVNEVIQEKYLTTSKYMTAATDTDYTEVKFIATDAARQRSYSIDSYALSAAYDESCFAAAYVSCHMNLATSGWKPKCSFELDELRTMTTRLNALPASMRPTITDADGTTRPVETIVEEMEALGFKIQDPTAQFKKQLLTVETSVLQAREEKILGSGSRSSLWAQNGSTTEVWATVAAGDAKATDEVDRYSDQARNWNYFFTEFGYNVMYKDGKKIRQQYAQELSSSDDRLISSVGIGNKITDPQNYIVLSAKDAKGSVSTWGGSGFMNWSSTVYAGRYGTVFNVKTGEVIEDQLLYAVEGTVPFALKYRVEYYPFGELNVTDNGRASLMSDYGMWYQTNWYAKGISDSNYAGSQNNSIDIRRNNLATD